MAIEICNVFNHWCMHVYDSLTDKSCLFSTALRRKILVGIRSSNHLVLLMSY